MKRCDLKGGMVVQTRNGMLWLVTEFYLISRFGSMNLSDYDEDLTVSCFHSLDIVKAYDRIDYWRNGFVEGLSIIADGHGKLIWKRPETVVTMQQIADEFGVSVELLHIKR